MVTFIPYKTKKILNIQKHVDGGWFWTKYSAYPYIGCQHGCEYCYCRENKYAPYKDPSDFSNVIKIKSNATRLLRKELDKVPKDLIFTGDYQPCEAKYEISRRMLNVCLERGFPVFILEKSDLVLRDMDLIKKINEKAYAIVSFSIIAPKTDETLRIFEPFAPPAEKRFEAMKEFAKEGILTGTTFIPVLPYLFDSDENLEGVVKKTAESGGKFVLCGSLTLANTQKTWYYSILKKHFPELVPKYEKLYDGKYAPGGEYSGRIYLKVKELCEKYGILHYIPRHIEEGPLAINKKIAEYFYVGAREKEAEGADSWKIIAKKKAAWMLDELDKPINEIYEKDGIDGLKKLPSIGESFAKKIEELLAEGF